MAGCVKAMPPDEASVFGCLEAGPAALGPGFQVQLLDPRTLRKQSTRVCVEQWFILTGVQAVPFTMARSRWRFVTCSSVARYAGFDPIVAWRCPNWPNNLYGDGGKVHKSKFDGNSGRSWNDVGGVTTMVPPFGEWPFTCAKLARTVGARKACAQSRGEAQAPRTTIGALFALDFSDARVANWAPL